MNKETTKYLDASNFDGVLPSKLKEFRKEKHLSLEAVGNMLGRAKSQVYYWETGNTTPTLVDIVKLCQIYDISFSDLLKVDNDTFKPDKKELEMLKQYRKADKDVKKTIQKILQYTDC